jgi:hypothetical protein
VRKIIRGDQPCRAPLVNRYSGSGYAGLPWEKAGYSPRQDAASFGVHVPFTCVQFM